VDGGLYEQKSTDTADNTAILNDGIKNNKKKYDSSVKNVPTQ